jgi:orotate phosphoribosyltransferase
MANSNTLTIEGILKQAKALITDSHVVLTSGRHSSVYINKDAVYPHTSLSSQIGKLFAEQAKDYDIDTVAAPALGGIILSQWAAFHLSHVKNKEIFGIYTEKTPEKEQIFTRGYDAFVKDKNVLVVEDLTTTGGSVKKVVESVRQAGGTVAAVGVMINRNPMEVDSSLFEAPFFALGELETVSYEEAACPLCKRNVPINTTVGHGKKYLAGKA